MAKKVLDTSNPHIRALVYLDNLVGGNGKFNEETLADNNSAMDAIISRCSVLLKLPETYVYNFPLSPQYDVYYKENHGFDAYLSPVEPNVYTLTVNDIQFDSRKYKESMIKSFSELYQNTVAKHEKAPNAITQSSNEMVKGANDGR